MLRDLLLVGGGAAIPLGYHFSAKGVKSLWSKVKSEFKTAATDVESRVTAVEKDVSALKTKVGI